MPQLIIIGATEDQLHPPNYQGDNLPTFVVYYMLFPIVITLFPIVIYGILFTLTNASLVNAIIVICIIFALLGYNAIMIYNSINNLAIPIHG